MNKRTNSKPVAISVMMLFMTCVCDVLQVEFQIGEQETNSKVLFMTCVCDVLQMEFQIGEQITNSKPVAVSGVCP